MPAQSCALVFDFSNVIYSPTHGLDRDLLLFLCSAVKSRHPLYILTASTAWKKPAYHFALKPIFSDIITTAELGSKADPATFHRLADLIKTPVQDLVLVDDTPENLKAIEQAGGKGILFRDNTQLVGDLEKLHLI